jgi:uncharacterized membrane protein SirB2
MIEFYGEIRLAHIAAVLASGGLFVVRGLLVQSGRRQWALAAFPRYLSYAIDTALLTAALMLLTILPSGAFANGWLALKLLLLPVYIGLGWLALRRGRTVFQRFGYFAGALLAYGCMFAIARTHDPLGPWRLIHGAWPA